MPRRNVNTAPPPPSGKKKRRRKEMSPVEHTRLWRLLTQPDSPAEHPAASPRPHAPDAQLGRGRRDGASA